FFSSRRRHTRFSRDWSSDVCSSDLVEIGERPGAITLTNVAGRVTFEDVSFSYQTAEEAAMLQPVERRWSRISDRPLSEGDQPNEIGRASCRERVESTAVAGARKEQS